MSSQGELLGLTLRPCSPNEHHTLSWPGQSSPGIPISLPVTLCLTPRWNLSSLPGSVTSFSKVGAPELGSSSEKRCKPSCRNWRARSLPT